MAVVGEKVIILFCTFRLVDQSTASKTLIDAFTQIADILYMEWFGRNIEEGIRNNLCLSSFIVSFLFKGFQARELASEALPFSLQTSVLPPPEYSITHVVRSSVCAIYTTASLET